MTSTDTSANVIPDALPPQDQIARHVALRDPRAVALGWIGVYLGGTGVILSTGGHWWLAVAHVGVMALALFLIPLASPRVAARTIGDVLPLIVAPLLYAEIPVLIGVMGRSYHDAMVQGWELGVFGVQPSAILAGRWPHAFLSELLHAGYLAYYVVIFLPPLLLLARGERRGFGETVLALTIAYTVCWTIFLLLPVEGPRYEWGAPAGVPDGPIRRAALRILAAGSSRGAAFPSSHMAVSVVQALMAWRWQRMVSWVLWFVVLLVGVGAVYGGFHYGVDMIAGTVLGIIVSTSVLATFSAPGHRGARPRHSDAHFRRL